MILTLAVFVRFAPCDKASMGDANVKSPEQNWMLGLH
jgi:hypothetical protein